MTTSPGSHLRTARICAGIQCAIVSSIGILALVYALASWLHDRHTQSRDEWAGLGEVLGLYVAFFAFSAALVLAVLIRFSPESRTSRWLLLGIELIVVALTAHGGPLSGHGPGTMLAWAFLLPGVVAVLALIFDLDRGYRARRIRGWRRA